MIRRAVSFIEDFVLGRIPSVCSCQSAYESSLYFCTCNLSKAFQAGVTREHNLLVDILDSLTQNKGNFWMYTYGLSSIYVRPHGGWDWENMQYSFDNDYAHHMGGIPVRNTSPGCRRSIECLINRAKKWRLVFQKIASILCLKCLYPANAVCY